jgi:hypothetical protein
MEPNSPSTSLPVRVAKGESLVVGVDSLSAGSALVPAVRVIDATGKTLAESPIDAPRQDVSVSFTAPDDGVVQVECRDRFGGSGPNFFYRLAVLAAHGDYGLSVTEDRLVLESGKPRELEVRIERRASGTESVGPIEISVEGLPERVTVADVVSEPAGPTAEKVTLRLSNGEGAGRWSGAIRIRGRARGPNVEFPLVRYARTPVRIGSVFETLWLTVK